MADSLDRARDLFVMNERAFAIMGVWPLQPTYVKFTIWFVYQVVHTGATTADFLDVFGNVDLMILNISENAWNLMVLSKMLVMRFSRTIEKLTSRVISDIDEETFDNSQERKMYLNYNHVAKIFFKLWVSMGIITSVAIHVKPLEILLRADAQNESVPLNLPYRTRVFFEINDVTFWLLWIYQLPVIYINTFQTATIGYLFSLILHVCGLMSILTSRIKQLDPAKSIKSSKIIFHDIVKRHRHILGIVDDINDVFRVLLLEELLICTMLIGLAAYNVILNLENSDKTVILASILESTTILLLIYGYCVAGEYLITESRNLNESFYLCEWCDMPESVKKPLMICMIGSCKPIQLLGGGFYIFSLENFTGVVKTAAGYISMLRAVV